MSATALQIALDPRRHLEGLGYPVFDQGDPLPAGVSNTRIEFDVVSVNQTRVMGIQGAAPCAATRATVQATAVAETIRDAKFIANQIIERFPLFSEVPRFGGGQGGQVALVPSVASPIKDGDLYRVPVTIALSWAQS